MESAKCPLRPLELTIDPAREPFGEGEGGCHPWRHDVEDMDRVSGGLNYQIIDQFAVRPDQLGADAHPALQGQLFELQPIDQPARFLPEMTPAAGAAELVPRYSDQGLVPAERVPEPTMANHLGEGSSAHLGPLIGLPAERPPGIRADQDGAGDRPRQGHAE